MSKHNYSQYSNKKKQNENVEPVEVVEVDFPQDTPEVKMVEETVETVALPKTVKGVVVDCVRLNVRTKPSIDAAVVNILDARTEVEIDPEASTHEWLCVCTAAGVSGYCMKKFIKATL